MIWRHRDGALPLDRPIVLGVLNVTPDSFSDGGLFFSADAAVQRAREMAAEGADLIDIGGESTRPQGAIPVSEEAECARVLPVIRGVRAALPATPISVDTVKSGVAAAALEAGASVINDVSGLRLDPKMGEVCAAHGAGVILMHSRGGVADMATYTRALYGPDVTGEVAAELMDRLRVARAAGIAADQIVLDPGIGFAKRSEHSLQVLAELPRIVALGFPVMVGASRKRFIGEITRVETAAERVDGSVGANVAALFLGARLFRVHDVLPHRHALDVAWQILRRKHTHDVA